MKVVSLEERKKMKEERNAKIQQEKDLQKKLEMIKHLEENLLNLVKTFIFRHKPYCKQIQEDLKKFGTKNQQVKAKFAYDKLIINLSFELDE